MAHTRPPNTFKRLKYDTVLLLFIYLFVLLVAIMRRPNNLLRTRKRTVTNRPLLTEKLRLL